MRPAIRVPLNTRPGVAQAPMEPGLRWLRWAPWEAPTPWKPCRFMTPAKPLPLLVPVTSISSPAAKVSTAELLADGVGRGVGGADLGEVAARGRPGLGEVAGLAGLVTLRPSISPKPTWMAL